jgi:hypothetical protein
MLPTLYLLTACVTLHTKSNTTCQIAKTWLYNIQLFELGSKHDIYIISPRDSVYKHKLQQLKRHHTAVHPGTNTWIPLCFTFSHTQHTISPITSCPRLTLCYADAPQDFTLCYTAKAAYLPNVTLPHTITSKGQLHTPYEKQTSKAFNIDHNYTIIIS